MRKHAYGPICLAVHFLVLTGSAGAQVIVGAVVEDGSRRPVVGALVQSSSLAGEVGPGRLTGSDGAFRLTLPNAGSHYLTVERIGFAATRVGPVEVLPHDTVRLEVTVATSPIRLEGLAVETTEGACRIGAEVATETQLIWNEARKALSAATWTEREGALRFRLRTRLRALAPRGLSVVREDRSHRTVWGGNSVRSLPPDDLAEGGYVRSRPDGEIDYFAPDAEVLLSDAFLETHCLRVADAPSDEDYLVGLTFEPIPGRDTTDVEGTLWLDRTSGRLDRLEFSYTGLSLGAGHDLATGEVHFTELADGHWIVTDWFIRAPVVGLVRGSGLSGTYRRPMVTSVMERGTEVVWVQSGGSAVGTPVEWRADSPLSSLHGTVFDSVTGSPLVGADVRLAGRGWIASSDANGRFELRGVPAGTYRVAFEHPRLDSLGVEPGWRDVVVSGESVDDVELAIPSMEAIIALGCTLEGGAVVGQVTDASGVQVPGATVGVVDVDGARLDSDSVRPTASVTDGEGWFRVCGLRPGASVRLEARMGPLRSDGIETEVTADEIERVDIELALSGTGLDADHGLSGVFGTVTDVERGHPLRDVAVALLDDGGSVVDRSLTGADGRFSLESPTTGRFRVTAELLGYGILESQLIPLQGSSQQLELRLASEAIAVEGVVVTVEQRVRSLERNGFYRRELMTGGRFLRPEDIDFIRPPRTTDILKRLPSVQRYDTSSRDGNTTVRRVQLRTAVRATGKAACLPAIYLDGAVARAGWSPSPLSPSIPVGYLTIDQLVSPHDIAGIEIYETPAQVPARFTGPGSLCGVLVIWTRRGPGG